MQMACAQLNINLKLCSSSDECAALFSRSKIYALVLDDAFPEDASQIRSAAQSSPSSKNAVSIAVVSRKTRETFGATFVVAKPITLELALRTLRAAQGQMANEFRRYFRHPLRAPVRLTTDANQELQATSLNVSRIGLGVRLSEPQLLTARQAVRARLAVVSPNLGWIELHGRVAWCDGKGRAGLQCQGITASHQKQLEQWLASNAI